DGAVRSAVGAGYDRRAAIPRKPGAEPPAPRSVRRVLQPDGAVARLSEKQRRTAKYSKVQQKAARARSMALAALLLLLRLLEQPQLERPAAVLTRVALLGVGRLAPALRSFGFRTVAALEQPCQEAALLVLHGRGVAQADVLPLAHGFAA